MSERARTIKGMQQHTGELDAAPLRSLYVPRHPLNLKVTLRPLGRGAADPTLRWDDTGVWRTLPTPIGAATLHLAQHSAEIRITAWGDGAQWAVSTVPELLGSGDDSGDFDVSANAFLSEASRRLPGLRLLRTGLVLEMMIAAILEQKITSLEARRAWARLIHQHSEVAPGPAPAGMRVFPSARRWALIPSWDWHAAGVDPRRSRTAIAAASVSSGLERTLALGRGGPEVIMKLRSVPGVGIWTAAETSQRSHGDADSVSIGDYHLPALVGWALIGKPVDDDGMLELLQPWAGQRQRVMRLIESSGFAKPRFGARMTIQDHRSH